MRKKRFAVPITISTSLLLASFAVSAETTVTQLLDSTFVHGQDKAAELVLNGSDDYVDLGITGNVLHTCKLTAFDGLFCLDYMKVRNWPHPTTQVDNTVASVDVLECNNGNLNLDDNKGTPCTGMTVDLDGNIWLAGKNKGKSHSLIKVVPASEACPGASMGDVGMNTQMCAYEVATGRPLLVDLTPVDGAVSERFSLPGHAAPVRAILGLEERKTAVAFLEDGTVLELASGKAAWGLVGNEQLLTITLLQLEDPLQNFILVSTTHGRILAWDTAGGQPAIEAFKLTDGEQPSYNDGPCSQDDPYFSVRASTVTDRVYFTDSQYCDVSVFEAGFDAYGTLSLAPVASDSGDLTFSTNGLTAVTGVTVAPGNAIDLSDCDDPNVPCPLVLDANGEAAASIAGVQLVDTSVSGLTLFQIEGMPDCRYAPFDCLAIIDPEATPPATPAAAVGMLIDAGVIVPLQLAATDGRDALTEPGAQRLNVTPLLPQEITELFPGGLPDMLLPRYVRGQKSNGFVFGGFFGVTEDGVVFRDTFEGRYNIAALAGSSLGCADNLGTLDWDIVGTVSERWESPGDDYSADGPLHLMSITNSGCGSSRTRDKGWSFKPYNLEPTPCTFNPDLVTGTWSDDGVCERPGGGAAEMADDAVYAKMLLVLVDDLKNTLLSFACADGDGNGVAPLDTAGCIGVTDLVDNMADKLIKCWDATQQPKQSSGDQNCQAFDSQLSNLQQLLDLTMPVGPDRANRVGELKARTMTMRHVFDTRFTPSLDDHFVEPQEPAP